MERVRTATRSVAVEGAAALDEVAVVDEVDVAGVVDAGASVDEFVLPAQATKQSADRPRSEPKANDFRIMRG